MSQKTNSPELASPAIETRLAEEIRSVCDALQRFGYATRSIREELPDSAQSDKLMVGLLSLLGFHVSYSLLKDLNAPPLLGNSNEYFDKLGLSFNDAVREVSLDGRKFMAIALIDKHS